MKWFTVSRLGDHMEETPEGFLLIRDVAIARCGTQLYRHNEVPQLQADEGGWLHIDREPQEVFHSDTLASYEGKPLVNDHPDMPVTPSNWADLAIGHIANIRRGQNHDHDLLFADILVTTDKGIRLIKSGKRAVSVGYDAAYEQTGRGRGRQTKIIANHLALVDEGRCGRRCTILDGKPVFSEDWVDAEPIGPRSPPKVRIHGEVDLEYAADPAPDGPMFRPRPKDPVWTDEPSAWTDDWYADIDWKEDQQQANPSLPEPKAQAEAWKAYNEVQKTQHEIGKEQTAQQEEMRAKHEQQRAAKEAEREDKRHGEPKASEAAPAKEDADHVKPPSATQGGSSGLGHDISKALKGALPDLGHMRVRQDKQGKLWVEASTEANSKGNPVTLPGSKGSAGVALKLDPVAKQVEFAEVNNGTATKGLGAKMVEATLKALPKDYTAKASADFSEGFWDKIRQAHPKRFAEDGWTADIDFVEEEHPRDEAGKFAKGSHSFGKKGQNQAPAALHGVKFAKWDAPKTDAGWEKEADAGPKINAPALPHVPKGKQMASGVIVREPDGRTWVIHPTNAHGGYKATMPKGGQEAGLSLRANAIKEAFEESGLRVRLTGHAADVERDTSVARYYHAERIGGTPDDHGWESEKVSLVEPGDIHKVLQHKNDAKLADIIAGKAKGAGSSPQATPAPKSAGSSPEATPASPASQSVGKPSGAPISTTGWKKVGGQLGSNPGAQMTDETGKKHYVKFAKSESHARNEHLAAKLYEAAGAPVLKTKLVDTGGETGTATEWAHDRRNIDIKDADDRRQAQDHFATHVWLANWDAAGLTHDNQAEVDGEMTTLDPGGSLIYRAQGDLKGKAFGDQATEWDSLHHPVPGLAPNKQAHELFGEMTPAQMRESAQKVASVPTKTIHDLVTAHGPGTPEQRKALAQKLVNRRNDVAKRAGLKTVDAKPRFAGWLAPVVSRTARGIIVSIMPRRVRDTGERPVGDDWQEQPRVSAGQEGGGQWTSGGGGAGLTLPGKIGSGQFHTHPVKVLEQAAQEGYAQGGKAGAIAAVQQAATKFKHAQVQGYAKKLQKLIQAHPETEAQAHAVGAHPDHPSEAEIDAMATQAGAEPEPEPAPPTEALWEPISGSQKSIHAIFNSPTLTTAEKLSKLRQKLPNYITPENKAYAEHAIALLHGSMAAPGAPGEPSPAEPAAAAQGGQMPDPFPGLSTGSAPAVPPLPEPNPANTSQTYLHGLANGTDPNISTEQALIWAKEDLNGFSTPANIIYGKQVVAHLEAKLKAEQAGQGAGGTPTPAQEPEAAPAASGGIPAPATMPQTNMHSALEWNNPQEAIAYIAKKMNESPHLDDKDYGKALIAHLKGQAPVESTPAEPDFPKPDENSFRQKMAHSLATGSQPNGYKLQNLQAIANHANTPDVDKAYVESLMDKLNAASQPEPAAPATPAAPAASAIPPIPANQSLSAMHSKIHGIASDPNKSLADKIDDIDDYAYGLPSTGHAAAYAKEVKAALKQQQATASAALHGPVQPAAQPSLTTTAPKKAYSAPPKPPEPTLHEKLGNAEFADPTLAPYAGSKGQAAVYKAATDPGLSAAEKMAAIDKVLSDSSVTGPATQTFAAKWKEAIKQADPSVAPAQATPSATPSAAAATPAAAPAPAAKPKNLHASANTKMHATYKALADKAVKFTYEGAAAKNAKEVVPTQNKAWWKKNSTQEQRDSIQKYKNGSEGINGHLREVQDYQIKVQQIVHSTASSTEKQKQIAALKDPGKQHYKEHADNIDELFEHDDAVLKQDGIFHRGEEVTPDMIEVWKQALEAGHAVRPQRTGFTSASQANDAAFSSQNVQYEILARKGHRGLGFWAATSSHQTEDEVVFRHGQTWEIYEIEKKSNGQHIVRCVLI